MATKNGLFKLQKCIEHIDKDISVHKKVTDIKRLTILTVKMFGMFPFPLTNKGSRVSFQCNTFSHVLVYLY